MPSEGDASALRNFEELETNKILKAARGESMKRVKRNVYDFTEFIGVPGAWAYAGPDFDF